MTSATTVSTRFGPPSARTLIAWGLVLGAVVSLGGCGGGAEQREVADTGTANRDFGSNQFPVPPEIQPNVDFWRHVYGVWSRSQVAIHDDKYMGVIYEVAAMPGFQSEGYSSAQKQFVESRKSYYERRTAELEHRLRNQAPLTAEDRELLAKFEKAGGTSAVYGASGRVRVQRGLRERFRRGLEISGRYDKPIREIMRSNGVPEDLAYLPHVESSFQTNARSSVGAAGIWQFMPSTGKLYMNVNGAVDDRLDPIICANGAAKYLYQAHAKLGSWPLAITSYNHGVGGMANARAQHGGDIGRIVKHYDGPAFGFASRNFYSEFVAAREVARNANRYFPEGVHYEQPWPYERMVLRSSTTAPQLANQHGVSTSTLSSINLHWRDGARSGRTALPAGTVVWVPSGSSRPGIQSPAYGTSGMLAQSDDLPGPSMSPKPKQEPVVAAAEPRRPEPVAAPEPRRSDPIVAEPARSPESSLSSWGGGRGIVSSASAAELPSPTPEPQSARVAKANPTKASAQPTVATDSQTEKPAKSASKTEPPQKLAAATPKSESKAAKSKPAAAKDLALAAAKSKPDPKGLKLADAKSKQESKSDTKTQGKAKPEAKSAKVAQNDKASAKTDAKAGKAATKFHVVKPQETLYRVATLNGISVEELRRLNKLGPKDNSIRPGQKLKVNI